MNMSLILDPAKSFVNVSIYYVEKVQPHGHSVVEFIRNAEDMEDWESNGYKIDERKEPMPSPPPPTPSMSPSQLEQHGDPRLGPNVQQQQPSPPPMSRPPISPDAKVIQQINVLFKRMSWREQNEIYSQSIRSFVNKDKSTTAELDPVKFREMKLKTCLKNWDLRDDNGIFVPISPDAIDNLLPEVAKELLDTFERITEPSKDELKKTKEE